MRASTGSSHSRGSIESLHDLIYEIDASLSGANSAGPSAAGSGAPSRDKLQHSQPPSSNGRSSGTWRATSELGYYYSDTGDSTASAQPPAAGIKIQQQAARSSTSSDGIGQYSQQQGTGWENDGSLNSSYNGGVLGGGLRHSSSSSYTADSPPPDSVQEADPQGQEAAIAAADAPQQEAPAETSMPALLSLPSTNSRRSASGPRLTVIAEEDSSCASTPSAMTARESGNDGTGSAAPSRFQSGGEIPAASAAPWSILQQAAAGTVGHGPGLQKPDEPRTHSRNNSEGTPPEQEVGPACTTASRALSNSATSSGSGGSMGANAQHSRSLSTQAVAQHMSQNGSTSDHSLSGGYPATSSDPSQAGSASHVILSNGQVVLAGTHLLMPPSPTTADMTAHLHDADPVDSWVASQAAALLPAPAWNKQRHHRHRQLQKTASVAYGGSTEDSPTYAWSSGRSNMSQQQQQQELGTAPVDPESQHINHQGEPNPYTNQAQPDTDVVAADPSQVATVVTAAAAAAAAPATPLKTNNLATPATSVASIASSSKQRSSLSGWLGSKAPNHSGGSETEYSAENAQQQQQQPGRRWPGNLGISAARQSSSNRRQSLMRESTSNSFHLQNGLPGWGAPPETPAFAGRTKRTNIPWDSQLASLDSVDEGQQQLQQQQDHQHQLLQSGPPQLLHGDGPAKEQQEDSLGVSQLALVLSTQTRQHQDALEVDHQGDLLQQLQQQQQHEQSNSSKQPDSGPAAVTIAPQPKDTNLHHALLSALNPLEYALWQQRQHQRTLLDRALHALTSLQADVDTLVTANQSAAVQAAAAAQCRDLVEELQQQLLSVQQQKVTGISTDSKHGDNINSKAAADGVVSSNGPWTIKADWMHQIDHNQACQVEGPLASAVAASGGDDTVDDFEAELLRLEAAAPGRRLSEETLQAYYAVHGMTDDGHDIVSQQQQQQQSQLAADAAVGEQQHNGVKHSPAVQAAVIPQPLGQPGDLLQEQLQQDSQPSGGVSDKIDDIEALLLALEAAIPGHRLPEVSTAAKAVEDLAVSDCSDSSLEAVPAVGQHELQQDDTQSEPADSAVVTTNATAAARASVLDDFEAELLAAESAEPGRRTSAEAEAEHQVGSETRHQQQQHLQPWPQESPGLLDGPTVDVAVPVVTFQLPSSGVELASNSSSGAEHSGVTVSASSIDDFEQELMALEAAAAAAAGVQLHPNTSSGGSSGGNDDEDELARSQGGGTSGQVAVQHVSESAADANTAHAQELTTSVAEQTFDQQEGVKTDSVAVMTSDDGIGIFAGSSSWPTHEDSHTAGRSTTTVAPNGGGKLDIAAAVADSIAIGTMGITSRGIFGGSDSSPSGVDYNHGEGDGHSRDTQNEDPAGSSSSSSSDDFEAMMRANETAAKAAAGRPTAAAAAAEDRWWEAEDAGECSELREEIAQSSAMLDALKQPADAVQLVQTEGQPHQEVAAPQPFEAPCVADLNEQQLLLEPGSISFDSTPAVLATHPPPPAPAASSGRLTFDDNLTDLVLDFGHVGSVGGDVSGVPLSPRTAATSGIREFDWLARIADEEETGDGVEGRQPGSGIAATGVSEEQLQTPGAEQKSQDLQQQELLESVVQHDVSAADGRQQPGAVEPVEQVTLLADLPCSADLAVTAALAEAQNETAAVSWAAAAAAGITAASNSTTDSSIPGAAGCSATVELLAIHSRSDSSIGRAYASSGSSSSSNSSMHGSETTNLEVPAGQQLMAEANAAAINGNLASVAAVPADTSAVVPGHVGGQQQQAQLAMLSSTEAPSASNPSAQAEALAAVPQADTSALAVHQSAQSPELVNHAASIWSAGPNSSSPQLQHQGIMSECSSSAFGSDIKPTAGWQWGLDYSPSARPATAPGQLGPNQPVAASNYLAPNVGGNTVTAAAGATEFSRISLEALEEVTRSASAAAAAARAARAQEARLASVSGSCASVPASPCSQSLCGSNAPPAAAAAAVFFAGSHESQGSPQKTIPAEAWSAAIPQPGSPSSSLTGRGSESSGRSRPQSLLGAAAGVAGPANIVGSSCGGLHRPQVAAAAAAAATAMWPTLGFKPGSPCSSFTGQESDTSGRSRPQSHLGTSPSAGAANVFVALSHSPHSTETMWVSASVQHNSPISSLTGKDGDTSGWSRPQSLLRASAAATASVPVNSSCNGHGSRRTATTAEAAVCSATQLMPGSPCSSVTGQGSDTSGRSRRQSLLGAPGMPQTYTSELQQQLQQQRPGYRAHEAVPYNSSSFTSSGSGYKQPCEHVLSRSSIGGGDDRCHVESESIQQHELRPQHQQQHAAEQLLLNSNAAQQDLPSQCGAHAGDGVEYCQQSSTRHQYSNGAAGPSCAGAQMWQRSEALGSVAVARASSSTSDSRPSTTPAASSSAGAATPRPLIELSQHNHQTQHQQLQAQHFDSTENDLQSVARQHLLSRAASSSSTSTSSSSIVRGVDDSSDLQSLSMSEQPLPHHTAWLFAAADVGPMSLQSRPSTSTGLDSKRCSINGWTAGNPPPKFLHMPSKQPKVQQNAPTSPRKPGHTRSSKRKQFGSKFVASQLRMIDRELENLEKLASIDMHEQQRLREELQQQRELWQQQLQLAEQQLRYEADSEGQQPVQQQQFELDKQRAALFGTRGVPAVSAVGTANAADGGYLEGHGHSPEVSGCGLCRPRSIQHTYEHSCYHTWRGAEDLDHLHHRDHQDHRDQQYAGHGADYSPVHSGMWLSPGRLTGTHSPQSRYTTRRDGGRKVRPYSAGSMYGVRPVGAGRQFSNHHTSTTQILRLDHTVQQPGHLYGQPIEHWVLPLEVGGGDYPSTCAPLPPATPEQRIPVAAAAPRVGEVLTSPAHVSSYCQAGLQHRPWTAGALQNTTTCFHPASWVQSLHVPSRCVSKVAAIRNDTSGMSCKSLWREVALECELEAVEQALLRTEVAGVAAETRVVSAALQSSLHLLL